MTNLASRSLLCTAGLALVFAAGCGGKTDVSGGTADYNEELKPEGSTLQCPKEVDGAEETVFECTLQGRSGKSVKVMMKIVKKDGELAVTTVDQRAYDTARQEVQAPAE